MIRIILNLAELWMYYLAIKSVIIGYSGGNPMMFFVWLGAGIGLSMVNKIYKKIARI